MAWQQQAAVHASWFAAARQRAGMAADGDDACARGPGAGARAAPATAGAGVTPRAGGAAPSDGRRGVALLSDAGGHAMLAPRWAEGLLTERQRANITRAYPPEAAAEIRALGPAVDAALRAAYTADYQQTWARELLSFEAFCQLLGVAPFPVQAMPLVTYLSDRVVRRGLAPTGLAATVSALRKGLEAERLGWSLDAQDEDMVTWLQRGFLQSHKGQNARGQKEPVHLALLAEMIASAERTPAGAEQEQLLLQMMLAHAGFLRTGEHAGGHLVVGDVEFLTEEEVALGAAAAEAGVPSRRVRFAPSADDVVGLRLRLRVTKTGHTEQRPQEVLIGRRADARLDVVGRLWEHFRRHGLGVVGCEQEPVFARVDPTGCRRGAVAVTSAEFGDGVRWWLERVGRPASKSGGHSLRRGACNDALDAGVPLDMVMRAGRWKSMAWMDYRRLTAATMRALASVGPQKGVEPLGSAAYRLLMTLKEGSRGRGG